MACCSLCAKDLPEKLRWDAVLVASAAGHECAAHFMVEQEHGRTEVCQLYERKTTGAQPINQRWCNTNTQRACSLPPLSLSPSTPKPLTP